MSTSSREQELLAEIAELKKQLANSSSSSSSSSAGGGCCCIWSLQEEERQQRQKLRQEQVEDHPYEHQLALLERWVDFNVGNLKSLSETDKAGLKKIKMFPPNFLNLTHEGLHRPNSKNVEFDKLQAKTKHAKFLGYFDKIHIVGENFFARSYVEDLDFFEIFSELVHIPSRFCYALWQAASADMKYFSKVKTISADFFANCQNLQSFKNLDKMVSVETVAGGFLDEVTALSSSSPLDLSGWSKCKSISAPFNAYAEIVGFSSLRENCKKIECRRLELLVHPSSKKTQEEEEEKEKEQQQQNVQFSAHQKYQQGGEETLPTSSSSSGAAAELISFTVEDMSGKVFEILNYPDSKTWNDLSEYLEKETGQAEMELKFIVAGSEKRVVKDLTLRECGVRDDSEVFLVVEVSPSKEMIKMRKEREERRNSRQASEDREGK